METEFEFISSLKSKYKLPRVGDDCAVIPKDGETDLVITADMLVEDIDFRRDWSSPEQIGRKALAVSLSDVAAMGAEPKWAMISIGIPDHLWSNGFADGFFAGWHTLAERFGVELVGGDISKSPGGVVIDSVAAGEVPKGTALLRSGAKPGDVIFVSGNLGGSAGGLQLLQWGEIDPNLERLHLEPEPHVKLANYLRNRHLVTSAIDVSDGLSSDLGHICIASGVGALVIAEWLPVHSSLVNYFSAGDALNLALHGGEDYGLLFTAAAELDVADTTMIGTVTGRPGVVEIEAAGVVSVLEPLGYKHF